MTAWILLRGLTRESGHWGSFPEQLRSEIGDGQDVQLFAPDLPGNGALHSETSPLGVADTAEWMREQLFAQRIEPPYYLLALSLGAMVAVAWANRHPDEIRGCVLINTSLRPYSPFYCRLKPKNYLRLLRVALRCGDDSDLEADILQLTSRNHTGDGDLLKQWIALRRRHPVSRANACRQLLAAVRYRAPPEKPIPPLLILGSQNDALVDISCSKELARRWHCSLSIHPTAGHDLPLDDGRWIAREVGGWLKAGPMSSAID